MMVWSSYHIKSWVERNIPWSYLRCCSTLLLKVTDIYHLNCYILLIYETNQLLHPQQFGFRPKYSTEMANCYFVENMTRSLDGGNVVGAVFRDMKKAFDTVNHSIRLSKWSTFNFSKQAVDWIRSYLQTREQCVKIYQEKLSLLSNKIGIPEGSILGPLLFSLFINNLPLSCPDAKCQLYADDTVIYASAKSPSKAAEVLTACLDNVLQWLQHNHL